MYSTLFLKFFSIFFLVFASKWSILFTASFIMYVKEFCQSLSVAVNVIILFGILQINVHSKSKKMMFAVVNVVTISHLLYNY